MSIRILVAGGRDTAGDPIGEDYSFVHPMTERLDDKGIGAEARMIEYLSLGHLGRLIDAIRGMHPDITVLQLGTSDSRRTFRNHLRRKFSMKEKEASMSTVELPPNTTFRPTMGWKMKSSVRLLADTLLTRDMVGVRLLEHEFSKMFGAIASSEPGHVIVLSPLPCADPLLMRYRAELGAILQDLSRAHGFVFLRSPLGQDNCQQYFADATHLNASGHRVVGQSIARVVSIVCRNVTVDSPSN